MFTFISIPAITPVTPDLVDTSSPILAWIRRAKIRQILAESPVKTNRTVAFGHWSRVDACAIVKTISRQHQRGGG